MDIVHQGGAKLVACHPAPQHADLAGPLRPGLEERYGERRVGGVIGQAGESPARDLAFSPVGARHVLRFHVLLFAFQGALPDLRPVRTSTE